MMKYRAVPAGYEDEMAEELDSIVCTTQNLKITVVPDITIGAGINDDNFDSELSAEMVVWFEAYREMWNIYKRTPASQQKLKTVLMKDPKPLLLALKLFVASPGCTYLKNKNLALFILETICDLCREHPAIAATCDDNTRMVAFNFVKTCGIISLYKAVTETYELLKIRELLIPKLSALVAQGHYKDVAYWTMYLELTEIFDIFDIVFPLILQDKVSLAEEYLNVAKSQQLTTVQFLDSLLDKKKTVYELCDEILNKYKYIDIKHNVLSYRPMSKLVTRLAKKYKIDANLTPNLNYTKTCSYLHYLYRKYQEGGMSCESWRELVRDAANSKMLQLDLVINIAGHGDLDEALYWANHYKIPKEECPLTVQTKLEQDIAGHVIESDAVNVDVVDAAQNMATDNAVSTASNSCVKGEDFLTLQLPFECVILVDSKEKFLDMVSYLEQQLLLAFDSEWKPSVCNNNTVSLLQLATKDRIYLLDCLAFQLDADLWRLLGRQIFNNLEILKIGFSLHQDLHMLQKTLPLQLNLQASACYLDLRELWRCLKYMQVEHFPYGQRTEAGEGLCVLTELCLGKRLDKSNQCSNWANRPLRRDQIVYAALDAYCLLQIYQVLAEHLLRKGIDMDAVVDEVTSSKTGCLFRMKPSILKSVSMEPTETHKGSSQELGSAKGTNIAGAPHTKFLCDVMLVGLSKELRKLGIDCDVITNALDLSSYIELARNESRYVLSRDARFMIFSQELPQRQCIQISTDTNVQQVLNVLNCLDIVIEERNLFTRCLHCNGNDFLLASKADMQEMRFGQAQSDNKSYTSYSGCDKTWNLVKVDQHIINSKMTLRGKRIKLNRIKRHVLLNRDYFYICNNCGVCTWDGAHSLHHNILEYITSTKATHAATGDEKELTFQ